MHAHTPQNLKYTPCFLKTTTKDYLCSFFNRRFRWYGREFPKCRLPLVCMRIMQGVNREWHGYNNRVRMQSCKDASDSVLATRISDWHRVATEDSDTHVILAVLFALLHAVIWCRFLSVNHDTTGGTRRPQQMSASLDHDETRSQTTGSKTSTTFDMKRSTRRFPGCVAHRWLYAPRLYWLQ